MSTPQEIEAGNLLIELIKKDISPDARDYFKEEQTSSKVLAHLCAPFNPKYMRYNTSRNGHDIYWGEGRKEEVLSRDWWATKVRAHEGQHFWDWKWLKWLYGMPHLLFILFLILFMIFGRLWGVYASAMMIGCLGVAYIWPKKKAWFYSWAGLGGLLCIVFAIWKTQWDAFWLAGAFICLSPLLNWCGAAWARALGEFRGYTISMAMNYWKRGSILPDTITWIADHFTSGDYYWMLPWKKYVMWRLKRNAERIVNGKILKRPWAKKVHGVLIKAGVAKV
jgi:hypothetical protein